MNAAGLNLTEETVERISSARSKLFYVDKQIYGGDVLGSTRKRESVEDLVRARREYQEALEQGERELGLRP